jgi:putative DNA methylase
MTAPPSDARSFIETQFPVSKLSKESYKERKANYSQTLTGLGKWWGRKPLVLIRAIILGLLLPATADPKKDREVFLNLMTMDPEGLLRRKSKSIPLREVYARLTEDERAEWFRADCDPAAPKYKKGKAREARDVVQQLAFSRMSYDEKLEWCDRPEHVDGPSEQAWSQINAHLGTKSRSLAELVGELGERRFGHVPRVGDAFCGGGSVPFEAARLGCDAYGSDLNPVAALLTWGALNIIGGGPEVAERVRKAQVKVYTAVDRQVTDWGIEHNEAGDRADAYLYCTETRCPECGWMVPMAPAWVIGEKTQTIAKLVPDELHRRFQIEIHQGVDKAALDAAKSTGTSKDARVHCPHCDNSTPIAAIRGDRRDDAGTGYGLRLWENDDLVPRPEDVFQERLYCIRYVHTWIDADGKEQQERYYVAPDKGDVAREHRVLELLRERFYDWQVQGFLPNRTIEPGEETTRLLRERGWTHWHHLFNPRQLLMLGCLMAEADVRDGTLPEMAGNLLGVGRCCDYGARLSRWHPHGANEKSEQVFSNQALNTLDSYAARSFRSLVNSWTLDLPTYYLSGSVITSASDAITGVATSDFWITDPPYADAVNYQELSEFFLAWYERRLKALFADWPASSRRSLAIRGDGEHFRRGMVNSYRNLAAHTPDYGSQVVMFTHQDASVWADLALILWAAGLRVTAAWTIATETESALKEGNYVQGTVLMVLRKQTSDEVAFLDEIAHQVEIEVEVQLESMLALEDEKDPNFSDSDYQLAAYAAALRVLTRYRNIQDLDIAKELARPRRSGEKSPIEPIIEDAVRTASNFLIPKGFPAHLWRRLSADEKFYLKGLDVERHGEFRSGVYQEFARGFGVREYQPLLASGQANRTRLKTASEFVRRELGGAGFADSLVRNILFAVYRAADSTEAREGLRWLRDEVKPSYWDSREAIVAVLRFFAGLQSPHWQQDAEASRLLAGVVENDHV